MRHWLSHLGTGMSIAAPCPFPSRNSGPGGPRAEGREVMHAPSAAVDCMCIFVFTPFLCMVLMARKKMHLLSCALLIAPTQPSDHLTSGSCSPSFAP